MREGEKITGQSVTKDRFFLVPESKLWRRVKKKKKKKKKSTLVFGNAFLRSMHQAKTVFQNLCL